MNKLRLEIDRFDPNYFPTKTGLATETEKPQAAMPEPRPFDLAFDALPTGTESNLFC